MRAKTIAALVLGLVLGVTCLGVILWRVGVLKVEAFKSMAAVQQAVQQNAPAPAQQKEPVAQEKPLPPPPDPMPDMAAGRKYEPSISPPPLEPPAAGSADRLVPDPVVPDAEPAPMSSTPRDLAMPIANVDPKKLSDTFNNARAGHKHEALDIPAPRGTPVLAVAEGNVVKLFTSKQGGLTVYQFDNTGTWCYYYAHLDHYASGLKEGTLLRKGDTLGYVGSTGDASPEAPHLHFAIFRLGPEKRWWQGTAINPYPVLRGE